MRTPILAALLTGIVALAGVADATGVSEIRDDSFETFDLTAVGGPVIYLRCANYEDQPKTFDECELPSLWQEGNPLPGLQSTKYTVPGQTYKPDIPLLG